MNEGFSVRPGRIEDVRAITRIYNYYILNTTATFDTEPKTVEDRTEWFRGHSERYPLFVAQSSGKVVGWASLRPAGDRGALRFSAESAVYVDRAHHDQGIGAALLGKLVDAACDNGFHAIVALIVGGNTTSVRLHEKLGFEHTGVMREVGNKFGQWLDVLIYERLLP